MNIPVMVRARKRKPQGVVLYRGPSLLNGRRIVVVATGLCRKSKNPKTGNMVQTYILLDRTDPISAVQTSRDEAICGDCPHRGTDGKLGSCYVNLIQGPVGVYKAVREGNYPKFNQGKHLHLFRERVVRLGSYGDPAAVPIQVWETILSVAKHWTGYTHQWRRCSPAYSRFCMASVETPRQREEAMAKGYRTFRVRLAHQPILPGEFVCPASPEGGHRLTCEQCKACSGAKAHDSNASPAIIVHGSEIGGGWKRRIYERTMARLEMQESQAGRIPLMTVI
jgi:hypothetical protein